MSTTKTPRTTTAAIWFSEGTFVRESFAQELELELAAMGECRDNCTQLLCAALADAQMAFEMVIDHQDVSERTRQSRRNCLKQAILEGASPREAFMAAQRIINTLSDDTKDWPDVYKDCPECGGDGTVVVRCDGIAHSAKCPVCEGSGIQSKIACQ